MISLAKDTMATTRPAYRCQRYRLRSSLKQATSFLLASSLNRSIPDYFADRPKSNSEEMQRCPYLHEMKERLLSQPTPTDSLDMERVDGTPVKEPNLHNDYPAHANPGVIPDPPEMPPDSLIGTVVKVRELHGLPSNYRSKSSFILLSRLLSLSRWSSFLRSKQNSVN